MIARFLAGMVLGAMVLVLLLAAFESDASVPKGGKFEGARPAPASCWVFCRPAQK
jgi:hypothetical protein